MRVVMLHTPDFKPAEYTLQGWRNWCANNNAQFYCRHDSIFPEYVPHWQKIWAMGRELQRSTEGEIVVWIDSDVMCVDELHRIGFLPLDIDLSISTSNQGWCTGFFAVRNVPVIRSMFDALPDLYCPTYPFEQQVMIDFIKSHTAIRVTEIPEYMVQNQESEFSDRAWAMHCWQGVGLDTLVEKGWSEATFNTIKQQWSTFKNVALQKETNPVQGH